VKIAYLHRLESNNLGEKNDWLKSYSELFDPCIDYKEVKKEIIYFTENKASNCKF
jgi:hypothetical protein